jgi:hypothetical protein
MIEQIPLIVVEGKNHNIRNYTTTLRVLSPAHSFCTDPVKAPGGSGGAPGVRRVAGGGGRLRRAGAVVAVGAVEADAARAQLLGQDRAQLESRSQLHAHGGGEMVLGEQRQARAIYPLLAEVLQQRDAHQKDARTTTTEGAPVAVSRL